MNRYKPIILLFHVYIYLIKQNKLKKYCITNVNYLLKIIE